MSDRVAREVAPAEEEVDQKQDEQKGAEDAKEEVKEVIATEGSEAPIAAKGEASDATVSGDSPSAAEGVPPTAQLAERISQSPRLPPGLRTRLAAVAGSGGGVEEVVRVVEESLPEVMRLSERDVARLQHPAGDVFFHGDPDAMSDEQAEAIARGQLARSGMLRGQRVAVD